MNRTTLRVGLVLAVVATALACGCTPAGPDRPATFAVTGKVTLDGNPLEGATVGFVPSAGGTSAIGTTDASGTYQLSTFGSNDGAVPGEYKVKVTKFKGGSGEVAPGAVSGPVDDGGQAPEDYVEGAGETAPAENELPPNYADPTTSGFSATVTENAGQNVFDFELKK
ncbi:MAG: carboxypeptidase regulatory-like domain-containing protein [Planctomycetaceae bacterium]|nr:carboxypeptidase regulatory-like domain-containing protein [Planctomycetaceae bacterium]